MCCSNNVLRIIAWMGLICGLISYVIGWVAVLLGTTFWGIGNSFWFYDAIFAALFGIFFLIASKQKDK